MASVLVVIVVFSILIVVHELGHFIMAKRCGVKVERFSIGFGPKIAGIVKDGTEYRISAIPLGGYVKMAGETHEDGPTGAEWEFLSKPAGQRFKIVACGPALNYILAVILFSAVFMIGAPTLTNEVGTVIDGYPAQQAGIRPGDRVVSIDGEDIEYWDELTGIMHKKLEGEVDLRIVRGEDILDVRIKPKVESRTDLFGKDIRVALVGITPSEDFTTVKYNPLEAIYKGVSRTLELTRLTLKAIWRMLTGGISIRKSMTGPLGIFVITAKAAKLGLVYLLNIMAVISASLAIFNLLPIPVLDGGHILFLAIEKARRRPLSPKAQERAIQAGLSLLIVLMLFVFYYDIMRMIKQ